MKLLKQKKCVNIFTLSWDVNWTLNGLRKRVDPSPLRIKTLIFPILYVQFSLPSNECKWLPLLGKWDDRRGHKLSSLQKQKIQNNKTFQNHLGHMKNAIYLISFRLTCYISQTFVILNCTISRSFIIYLLPLYININKHLSQKEGVEPVVI